MNITKLFRQLFCKHDIIEYDLPPVPGVNYSKIIYRCRKCDKIFTYGEYFMYKRNKK